MDSWENIILQWVNCLCDSNNNIKTIEELEDGKIYYNLINRIIPWNSSNSNKSQRDMVLQFLKDEYPNFPLKNENSAMSKLCIASLLLSRLTLEPIFHDMLCIKLEVDIQIKVKSILETVYSLDKTITEQDLYNVFSLSSKNSLKLLDTEPKFLSDEFVETPEPMDDDNVQLEQFKQIRLLKVQIETMGYEHSDLTADIEDRDRQIKELQNKLQEALAELKQTKADNFNLNNNFIEPKDKEEVVSACQKEDESLKKCIYRMHAENRQLQDQKKALATEVKKLYVEKHQELTEKIETKKKAIELVKLTKIQERQIKDLQNKLQGFLFVNSTKLHNSTFSVDLRNRSAEEIACSSKLKCLEKSVMKLKTKNYQLEKEKRALVIDELKLYKEKHYILKEKNANMKKAFEAMKLIKSQERQIKDLQNKLTGTEKNLAKLKTRNYELVQEKRALTDELKFYKGKYGFLKIKKSENMKK